MKEKIKTHFQKIGGRRFVILAILILIVTDLLNTWYLKLYWVNKDFSHTFLRLSAERGGMTLAELNPDTVSEMKQFVDRGFYFFLLIILANNFFFYFFYLRRKLWAQGYVLFYTLTAALFAVTFLFEGTALGIPWFAYNVSTILIYAYLYLGVKILKEDTVGDVRPLAIVSPERETTEL